MFIYSRVIFFSLCLLFSNNSFALIEVIKGEADKILETTDYIQAVEELSTEIFDGSKISKVDEDLKKRINSLRAEVDKLNIFSNDIKSIINGPDWSSTRVLESIRNTAQYINRIKNLAKRLIPTSSEVKTAKNTAETNYLLAEMQKNQQALILQNKELQLLIIEMEMENRKKWVTFIDKQNELIYNREKK